MKPKIDMSPIETEYVTGNINYSDLAKRHGISVGTLGTYAKANNWVKKREEWRQKAAKKAQDKAATIRSNELLSVALASDKLAELIRETVFDEGQFNLHLVQTSVNEDGATISTTEEKQFRKRDTKAIRDLVNSLKELTSVIRNVHGLPTVAEAEAQRIAAERLKMDQQKMQQESENRNAAIDVHFADPDMEDYAK